MRTLHLLLALGLMSLAAACSGGRGGGGGDGGASDGGFDGDTGGNGGSCAENAGGLGCEGTFALTCSPTGMETGRENCSATGRSCVPGVGCAVCTPGQRSCEANSVTSCRADGSGFDVIEMCTGGNNCDPGAGACTNLCDAARASNSYIGCEYFPVVTSNSQVATEFQFGVAVANPQTVIAEVTITRAGAAVETRSIAPGAVEVIPLPWVNELKQEFSAEQSRVVRGGAYKLVSSVPVTVYQFNPLDFRIDQDCANEDILDSFDGQCFSFSNDASLLLPSNVLTGNYTVMSRKSLGLTQAGAGEVSGSPTFFTVVGVDPNPVTVTIQFAGAVQADSVSGEVGNFEPGSEGIFSLNQGDVLQIVGRTPEVSDCTSTTPGPQGLEFCNFDDRWDLTGSEIRASGRVAVISGHNCGFVPFDKFACDHLEEAMFPEDTWGRRFVVGRTQPINGDEPNVIKVLSGANGNMITFEPAVNPPVTLNKGETIEFEARQSFQVVGTGALLVGQFLVGQNYADSMLIDAEGDPAFSLAIPAEQFRNEYSFLAPDSFSTNYVQIIAPMGASATLDGTGIVGFQPVGSTGMQVANIEITGGAHKVSSGTPVGIVVYGFGQFTSYMYPGGLDLEAINPLE